MRVQPLHVEGRLVYVRLVQVVVFFLWVTGASSHAYSPTLREYTLHQIEQMLKGKDFSIATQAQLKMAKKLILEAPRLMEKGGDL